MKRNLIISLIILVMMIIMFVVGLYAGGWFWLSTNGYENLSPSITTLIDQGGINSLTDEAKEMLPFAWCFPVALAFAPLILSLFVLLGGSGKGHKNLHGNARFANRREIKKVWYTEPEK